MHVLCARVKGLLTIRGWALGRLLWEQLAGLGQGQVSYWLILDHEELVQVRQAAARGCAEEEHPRVEEEHARGVCRPCRAQCRRV